MGARNIGTFGETGPFTRQFDVAVNAYRRNTNGFHPKPAQEKIDGALRDLRQDVVAADKLLTEAVGEKALARPSMTRSLEASLRVLTSGRDGLDATFKAVKVADEQKVRTFSPLDQAAAQVAAKRQQDADAVLAGAIGSIVAAIGSDFGMLIAEARGPAERLRSLRESDALEDPKTRAHVKAASDAAAKAGVAALSENPKAIQNPF